MTTFDDVVVEDKNIKSYLFTKQQKRKSLEKSLSEARMKTINLTSSTIFYLNKVQFLSRIFLSSAN